ncbi:MAG: hypothetical protein ACE5IR_10145, partial [bacterium]
MKRTKVALITLTMSLTLIGMTRGQDGGSISGAVTYKGTAPAPAKLKVDKDMEICGKEAKYSEDLLISKAGGLQNVVVQVVGAKGEVTIAKGKD